jgi:hypothetical protein
MVEKKLALHEIKYYHDNDLGFVFLGNTPSSDSSIQKLADFLVSMGVSQKLPECYIRVSPTVTAFIYAKDSGYKSGAFYQACQRVELRGVYRVESLGYFLDNLAK